MTMRSPIVALTEHTQVFCARGTSFLLIFDEENRMQLAESGWGQH